MLGSVCLQGARSAAAVVLATWRVVTARAWPHAVTHERRRGGEGYGCGAGPETAPLRAAKEQDIKRPVDNSRRVPAPDMHRQRVTAQSMVEIVDGPHKSKVGTVAHVRMPNLWVQCSSVQKVLPCPALPCPSARPLWAVPAGGADGVCVGSACAAS